LLSVCVVLNQANYIYFGTDGVLEPLEVAHVTLVPITRHMHNPFPFSILPIHHAP
jgi:hypothetical protein